MQLKEITPGLFVSDDGRMFKECNYNYRGGGAAPASKYPFVVHKRVKHDVHRAVAMAFIPNPDNKPFVCHADDTPSNNEVANLWWGTPQENMSDMWRKGRARLGSIKNKHLPAILQGLHDGLTQRQIAESLGITEGRVSQIINKYKQA